VVLLQRVGRGRHPEHQRNLLHELQHSVLAGVASGRKICPLYPVKLLHYNVVNGLLLGCEGQWHLMDAADLLAGNLRECAGDDRLSKNIVQLVCVVDVLGPLTDSEYRGLLGQVAGGEQRVPSFVSWNGTSVISVAVTVHILTVLIVGVNLSAPCNHVNGIVVEQF